MGCNSLIRIAKFIAALSAHFHPVDIAANATPATQQRNQLTHLLRCDVGNDAPRRAGHVVLADGDAGRAGALRFQRYGSLLGAVVGMGDAALRAGFGEYRVTDLQRRENMMRRAVVFVVQHVPQIVLIDAVFRG